MDAAPEQRGDAFDLGNLIHDPGGNKQGPCANKFPGLEAHHKTLRILFCRAHHAARGRDRLVTFKLAS